MSKLVPATVIVDVSSEKEALIRLVCGSLIKEPTFDLHRKSDDADSDSGSDGSSDDSSSTGSCRDELKGLSPPEKMLALGRAISLQDGEFLLKLAVYVRQFLGIRGTANFLTSIAAFQERCHPYLRAYLPKIVCLPTDWLQIATFARDSPLRKTCGLPTALRTALAESFSAFNEFSLAKYNTESAQKKRKKKGGAAPHDDEQGPLMPYTLKQMVRMLHISEPRYEVMCLLGKPYPASSQEFSDLGLGSSTREFDPSKANRRMRLAIPKTWETELASKGNHAHVWDALVAEKKLPFMAMLRNLRNIILQGCSRPTHNFILARLQSEEQIAASKQFPYRFFSAFDVLNINPETTYDAPQVKRAGAPTKAKPKPPTAPTAEQLAQLLKEYRGALEQAIALATKINVSPMPGRSMVLLHCSSALLQPVKAQGAKGIGSVRTKLDVALLLAIMLQYSCEACDFIVFTDDGAADVLPPVDRTVGLLEVLTSTKGRLEEKIRAASSPVDGRVGFPYAKLDDVIHRASRVECVLLVSDQHLTFRGTNPCPALGDLPQYLSRMRLHCNPDLLLVALAIDGSESEPGIERLLAHPNDVLLTGFSDSILRFIAERSNGGPRQFIERIDTVYRIDTSRVVTTDSSLAQQRRFTAKDDGSSISDDEDDDGDCSDGSDSDPEDDSNDASREREAAAAAALALRSNPAIKSSAASPLGVERPMSSYRLARWFISSTFLDMQGERDELMFHVFPSLQRWINQRGYKIDVAEIDFRWGIDSVDGYAATPVSVCLNEVSRCAPMVLGVVGDRYGSLNTLPRSKICADSDVAPSDFDWLRRPQADESVGMSITELELRHAVHVTTSIREGRRPQRGDNGQGSLPWSPSASVGVMLRIITGTLPAPLTSTFAIDSKENNEKLRALKSFVKSSPAVMVETYQAAAIRSPASATAAAFALDLLQFRERALSLMKRQLLAAYDLVGEVDDEGALESAHPSDSEADLSSSSECATDSSAASGSSGREDSHATADVTVIEESGPAADQSHFRQELCQVYVPPRHSYSAVEKFLRGQPLVSTLGGEGEPVVDAKKTAAAEGSVPNVLLLHSEPGRGKSSFVSYVVEHTRETGDMVTVFFSLQAVGAGHRGASGSEAAAAACVCHVYSSLRSHFHLQELFPAFQEFSSWQLASEQLPAVYQACCKQLRGSRAGLVVVIDGFDGQACDETSRQRLLSLLPNLIPPLPTTHVKWIFATHHASPFAAALRARALPCASYALPDLGLPERMQLVRNHLATFGKVLRESVTKGNLVKQLCRKADGGMTTYLLMALTFLRLFGNYDTLAQDIRRLPGMFAQLQAELMRRCEVLFGADVCATALAIVALSRDLGGIREDDLLRCCENVPSTTRLVNFLFHHRMITGDTGRGIRLHGDALQHAVQRRYLSRTADVHRYHTRVLRSLLRRSPGAEKAAGGKTDEPEMAPVAVVTPSVLAAMSPATIVAVLFHALRSKNFAVVAQIGRNVHAIAAIVRHGLLNTILELAAAISDADRPTYRKLLPFVEFLVAHRHIIAKHPSLTLQCALNMPTSSPVRRSALDDADHDGPEHGGSWMEWRNRASHGERECTQTSVVGHRAILCATLSNRGDHLAVGGRDWRCRVFVNSTSAVLHDLKHPNDVTAVSFSGNDSVIVTGCADGALRVWSMADGCLTQEGLSHSRCVTSVAVPLDSSKNLCVTSSTDTTVQMWRIHVSSGGGNRAGSSAKLRPYRTSRIHRAPVACCALHSSGKVASASWDGVVVVQSSERDESRAVVMPVSGASAIRALAFVPSMVLTVAAGSFDGRVFLLDVAGELVSAVFDMHGAVPLSSLHISSDAKFMLSADTAGCMKLWRQTVTGEIVGSFNGHSRTVCAVRFYPTDSTACVSVSMDSTARHWRVTHPGIDWPVGAVHDSRVVAVAVSHNGHFAVTACASGTAKVFRLVCDDGAEEDSSISPERPWLTIRANLHQSDSRGAAPLCFASVVAQDQLILLGDIVGRVGGWSPSSGLEGSDALLRFTVVCPSATQPVRAVHLSGTSKFTVVTLGGESFSWLYDWERAKNSGPVSATPAPFGFTVSPEIRHPVVAVLSPSQGVEEGEVESRPDLGPLLVTEQDVLNVDFTSTPAAVDESETRSAADSAEESNNGDVTLVRCGALCGVTRHLLLAFADGSVVLFLSHGAEWERTTAKVRLRDDCSHRSPLEVLCIAVAAVPPRSSALPSSIAVLGGADHTFRVLRVDLAAITQVAMFHGTAPIRSVCCTPHSARNGSSAVVVGGDDLGNVYKLELHLYAAPSSSSVDGSEEESATSTVTETQTSRTRSSTAATPSEPDTNWIDGYDQFCELGIPMPPGLSAAEKKRWNQRQRLVLREAVAASRTNPLAKAALRRYASASLQTFSVFCGEMS